MGTTIEEIYRHFREHPTVSTDTRNILPGSIFFALRGESFNGNDFARNALAAGAALCIVDDPALPGDPAFIRVENVLTTLQALALHHRRQFSIPVIGITGTNGKTTTKELIHRVLSKKFRTLATAGNRNNHIGVPLTLLGITSETEIAVVEMGANHPGEIDFLCRLAEPGFGLITNIGKAHLEGFGGYEGVIRTKTELYRFLAGREGTIFLHKDDATLTAHIQGLHTVTYGTPPADLAAESVTADPFVSLVLNCNGTTVPV
ncbi:MAG TPA: Mur ligase family protein, partial [Bacteroidales bacterium]|nr:Mur ligase family protein [Bacteroidales bacterium]